MRRYPGITERFLALASLVLLGACAATTPPVERTHLVISVVGTNDVHGALVPQQDQGGLATVSGYVDALRAARAGDGGAVLLIDAGDMWQGTLEANLVEGKSVVEAYNAMAYDAATIGNHEFDFGPEGPAATPRNSGDDPRGALKQRAREMQFPLLSANLVDLSTRKHIDWDNVTPSIMLDVQGVSVGIVGVITRSAPATTIKSNIAGLEVEPLARAINREAERLRGDGAQLVIVTAHAGARCSDASDPYDTSPCDMQGEIMRVANALPPGLVDHIIAGHVHGPVAHIVNEISITSGEARTEQFGRVDFVIDRTTGIVIDRTVFPPQVPCPWIDRAGACVWDGAGNVTRPRYEGMPVEPNPAVVAVSNRAVAHAESIKNEALGPVLDTPIAHDGNPESPLANLFVDAVLAGADGDIAIHNVSGGMRANLAAGPVTFGDVYQVMPFDNRVMVFDLSGAEIRRIMAAQAHNHRRRAGIAGVRVKVRCRDGSLDVQMTLNDGRIIADDDRIHLVANDFLALGGDGLLTPVIPEGGFDISEGEVLTRDLLVEWFRATPGHLRASDFMTQGEPRWDVPADLPANCSL